MDAGDRPHRPRCSLRLVPYSRRVMSLPKDGRRCLLAQFDDSSVVVFQAYNDQIARFSVDHGYFGGDFSFQRMSWVKPSFTWMCHRSGWATKHNQEVGIVIETGRYVKQKDGSGRTLAERIGQGLFLYFHFVRLSSHCPLAFGDFSTTKTFRDHSFRSVPYIVRVTSEMWGAALSYNLLALYSGFRKDLILQNILALRLRRDYWEDVLSKAVLSSPPTSEAPLTGHTDSNGADARTSWHRELCRSTVVMQWDPEHEPFSGKRVGHRVIQLGLRGDTLAAFRGPAFTGSSCIEDITDFVHETAESRCLRGGYSSEVGSSHWGNDDQAPLMVPEETFYPILNEHTAERLGIKSQP